LYEPVHSYLTLRGTMTKVSTVALYWPGPVLLSKLQRDGFIGLRPRVIATHCFVSLQRSWQLLRLERKREKKKRNERRKKEKK
jgi:hypothetical protein